MPNSKQPPRSKAAPKPEPASRLTLSDAFADIDKFAGQATSAHRFYAQSLACVARVFNSPLAAIHVQSASDVIHEEFHQGTTDPNFWRSSLQQFLTEILADPRVGAKQFQSRRGNVPLAFLAAPIFDRDGRIIGAMALVDECRGEQVIREHLVMLESLACWMSHGGRPPAPKSSNSSVGRGETVERAAGMAAKAHSPTELAFAVTNSLQNRMGFEQVALAMVERHRIRILSISGLDEVKPRSPGIVAMRAAMEECADMDETLVYQPGHELGHDVGASGHRLHRQWHAAGKGDHVASLPLRDGGRVVGVVSLRARSDRPFSAEQLKSVASMLEPVGPAMRLVHRAQRSLRRHARDVISDAHTTLFGRGHLRAKIGTAMAAALLLTVLFGRVPYRVTVPIVIEPTNARSITVPHEAVLESVYAVQGDFVRQGDILCEFDQESVEVERRRLLAELEVAEREEDHARAANTPIEAKLAGAKRDLALAQLNIMDWRLHHSVVRSPIDGYVIEGDLRQQVGMVMPQGHPLFRIAAPRQWTLELAVPEHAAAQLLKGTQGTFATVARPEQSFPLRVDRIHRYSETRDGRNVIVAEACPDPPGQEADWIRPGMEGVARLEFGKRSLAWIMLHRLTDYLHLRYWI